MGHKPWRDIRDQHNATPEQLAQAERDVKQALSLAELRKARELTQTQLARSLETNQSGVSRIEHQTDLYVSTLRSYVEALGGRLELVAVFEDGAVQIGSFEELAEQPDRELVPA